MVHLPLAKNCVIPSLTPLQVTPHNRVEAVVADTGELRVGEGKVLIRVVLNLVQILVLLVTDHVGD